MATYLYIYGETPTVVPDPAYDVTETHEELSEEQRAVDGTLIRHITTLKHRWQVRWAYLSHSEASTLKALLLPKNQLALQFPWETSPHTVMVSNVSIVYTQFGLEITGTFEEV